MKSLNRVQMKRFTPGQFIIGLASLFFGITVVAYAVTVDFAPGTPISSTAVEDAINQNRSVAVCSAEVGSSGNLAGAANIQTVSITVPGPGNIVASAYGYFSLNRTGAASWNSGLSISQTSATISQVTRQFWGGPAGMPTGQYYAPISLQGSFAVAAAGTYTYFFIGWNNTPAENIAAAEYKICAVFAPN